MVPCVRHVGWSCFISALQSNSDWVHNMTNEISGRSTGILDFLLKRPVSDNRPFKGQSIHSHFVCVSEILRETKLSLNHAYYAHNLFVYSKCIRVGVKWTAWGPFQVWQPTKICKTNWIQLKDYKVKWYICNSPTQLFIKTILQY
jgi:hypothetical protein